MTIHPQEALLQEARAFQRIDAFAPYRKLIQVAEHRIARLMQLAARQARYFGRVKTLYQLLMATTVANLTLVATKIGLMRGPNRRPDRHSAQTWDVVVAFIMGLTVSIACRPGLSDRIRSPGPVSVRVSSQCRDPALGPRAAMASRTRRSRS